MEFSTLDAIAAVLTLLAGLAAVALYRRPWRSTGGKQAAGDSAPVPGGTTTLKTQLLEGGAAALQSFRPLSSVHQHLCGFHCYSGDVSRQVIAHHFCAHLSEGLQQCIIYDSDRPDAKLIGVEYVISSELYAGLPAEERVYWHSHRYEVAAGTLIAVGLPAIAEHVVMEKLVGTYGKTIHTWQVDRGDTLPLGPPRLMMALTRDGQLRPEVAAARDKAYGVSTAAARRQREDLWEAHLGPTAPAAPEADLWELTGEAVQFLPRLVPVISPSESGPDPQSLSDSPSPSEE